MRNKGHLECSLSSIYNLVPILVAFLFNILVLVCLYASSMLLLPTYVEKGAESRADKIRAVF
jgi:hypothetical protein